MFCLLVGFNTIVLAKPVNDTSAFYGNLYHTCKVWGFLKYYHPNITQKNIDWDHELFLTINKISGVKSPNERNKIFTEWIDALGSCSVGEAFVIKDSLSYSQLPDLTWISDKKTLGEKLSNQLTFLYKQTNFKNKYVQFDAQSRPAIMEEPYMDFDRSDKKYYLLSLFRYWNVIEYYFPYKHLITKRWDDILKEEIPVFYNTTNEYDYFLNLKKLAVKLEDAHSLIVTYGKSNSEELMDFCIKKNIIGFHGIPVELELINNRLLVVGYCNKKGYKELILGDQILKFDNKELRDILAYREQYYAKSNTSRGSVFESILTSDKDSVEIEYLRDDSLYRRTVQCDEYLWDNPNHKSNNYILQDTTSYYKILDGNIAYIDSGKVEESDDTYSDYQKIKNCKGLIFDLRKYPRVCGFYYGAPFVRSPYRYSLFSFPSQHVPGAFEYQFHLPPSQDFFNPSFYKGPIAVIVNNKTQSAGETMALQFKGRKDTKIIGNQTAGANGDVRYINLPGGFKATFSSLGVYYPDKTGMQKIGVRIDEIVYPTLQGIKQGRDELLERAIEYIWQFKTHTTPNLNFEDTFNGTPDSWCWNGLFDDKIKIDSADTHNGNYSLSIESLQNANDTIIAINPIKVPEHWKSLKVTAYIKADKETSNAGVCLHADQFIFRVDDSPNQDKQLNTSWQKIEYSFENNGNFTNEIYLSLYLTNRGKVWFDDISLDFIN